jgi:hypothetical protein
MLMKNATLTEVVSKAVQIDADFIQESKQKLLKGIRARKFHYSKMKSKPCRVYITAEQNEIFWDYDEFTGFNLFSNNRCHIYDVEGLLLGPQTHTFRAYRI